MAVMRARSMAPGRRPRAAMKAFIERMNASLPVEEPDPVLYAMVQGERDQVCGKACAAGEGLSADGRCVPVAILAIANRKISPAADAVAPRDNLVQADKLRTVITGWSSTTTLAAAAPTITGGPSRSISPPIEGRMALAGPTAEPAPSTETLAPRSLTTRSAARTAPVRAVGGQQRWSSALFNPRNSNN